MVVVNPTDEIMLVITDEPGRRPAAPGSLRLVQQFVNTNDQEGGRDQLASRDVLAQWLALWTEWPRPVVPTRHEHARALAVREGIRHLAEHTSPDDARFETALRALDIRLVAQAGQLRLDSPDRLGRALCPILDTVRAAMDDGTWTRMKVCSRDRCRWLYYDSSRNRSSKWCATAICGSREKARRAHQRKLRSE